MFTPGFSGVSVGFLNRCLSSFLFLVAIVLTVLRYEAFDCPVGVFKLCYIGTIS